MKPCLVEQEGRSIALSHPRLPVTWNQGGIWADARETFGARPQGCPKTTLEAWVLLGGPRAGWAEEGVQPEPCLCPQSLRETESPLREWGACPDPSWLGGWGRAGRETGCRPP